MSKTSQVHLPVIFSLSRRLLSLTLTLAVTATIPRNAPAVDALAYSFENDLQGFHPNGLGTTITQDTIGATQGTHSMKVSIVGGATFVGALTPTLDPTIFGDPPGLDHVHFDMTITQRFDQANPNPPPDRIGFARIGVIIFATTQPDFPGGQQDTQVQIANLSEDEVPVSGLEPGTYKDQRIDLDKLADPVSNTTKTFNEIFGTLGSGPNDLIPTGFELYFNKTGDPNFPLTVYIDNIRFGTSVPGDYNGNDVVDAADYVLWRKNPGPVPANFNFRNEVVTVGTVEPGDYTAWRARFGNNSASGASLGTGTVPEPASGLLLLVAACAAACRRAHRSLVQ